MMKISKCKKELARIISENGGWVDGSGFASQDKVGSDHDGSDVCFYKYEPIFTAGKSMWNSNKPRGCVVSSFKTCVIIKNWHQTILSREEYYQAYPKADADGWIEWSGGECPVSEFEAVQVKYKIDDGSGMCGTDAGELHWLHEDVDWDIVAYRLHKQQPKPEFCESVMRSIPEPEAKPTIEQLAADYRNKLDYANRKQDEADKANMESDAALAQLEGAIAEIGFAITPLAATEKEPELVAAVKVGDQVECVESIIKRDKYNGMVGRLRTIDESDTSTPYLVDFGGEVEIWCHKVKFIRRP